MLLYVGITAILPVFYIFGINKTKPRRAIFCTVAALFFSLLVGLRALEVGNDTLYNSKVFDWIVTLQWSYNRVSTYIEPGYYYLIKFLSLFSKDSRILLMFVAFITYPVFFWFMYKNSKDVILSTVLFVGLQFLAMTLNTMRQSIAISLILVGLQLFLFRKKYIFYAIFCVLAFFFHRSSIVSLLFIPLMMMKGNKANITFVSVVSLLLFAAAGIIVEPIIKILHFEAYLGTDFLRGNNYASIFNFLLACLMLLVLYVCLKGHTEPISNLRSKEQPMPLNFLIYMGIAYAFFNLMATRFVLAERMNLFFIFILMVGLPNVFSFIPKKQMVVWKVILIVVAVAYCAIVLAFRPEWTKVVPYKFYL